MITTALALFVTAFILAKLDGPLWLIGYFRQLIKRVPRYGEKLHEGASCQFCIGFWLVVLLSLYRGNIYYTDTVNEFVELLPVLAITYFLALLADLIIESVRYLKYMRM